MLEVLYVEKGVCIEGACEQLEKLCMVQGADSALDTNVEWQFCKMLPWTAFVNQMFLIKMRA